MIFASYAVGVTLALFFAGHLSDGFGRKRMLIPALVLSLASAALFLVWRDLPGLIVARVINGLSVGIVTATATAYLAELHSSPKRAQIMATTANLGGLGIGPIIAGTLAQTVDAPLTVPYLFFAALLVVAVIVVALAPETVTRPQTRPAYRPQRIAVPAAARASFFAAAGGAFVSFAAFGLFTSLAPSFLAHARPHEPRAAGVPALTGFGAAILAQLAAAHGASSGSSAPARAALSAGLALLVTALGHRASRSSSSAEHDHRRGRGLLFKAPGSCGRRCSPRPPRPGSRCSRLLPRGLPRAPRCQYSASASPRSSWRRRSALLTFARCC